MNRFSEMQNALNNLEPNVCIRVGGAGNKGIYIINGVADCMVHVVEGIKFWDLCGVDALIKSRLGITSNKNRKPLIYDDKAKNFTVRDGIIMARSEFIYDLIHIRLHEYLKNLRVKQVV